MRGVEVQLGRFVGKAIAEFGQSVIVRRRIDGEEPAVGAVVAHRTIAEGARQVAPVGRAGLGRDGNALGFLHATHGCRPRLFGTRAGGGRSVLGFQAEEEADGDHRREHDKNQNCDEDEAPAVARAACWKSQLHGGGAPDAASMGSKRSEVLSISRLVGR